jgi:hypothetical protein
VIQLHLHAFYSSLLDWDRLDEAEDDLRDAVVEATGRLHYDTCSTEDLIEAAEWLASEEEAADRAPEPEPNWQLEELTEALKRRLYDHQNDLREPEAAE